jgi:hypothetical protein
MSTAVTITNPQLCPLTNAIPNILRTETVGYGYITINDNFKNIKDTVCTNFNTINNLTTNIQIMKDQIDTLQALATPGVSKAWVSFDGSRDKTGTASTFATERYIYSSYNINSVYKKTTTDTPTLSAGDYEVRFTSGLFSDSNYVVLGTSSEKKDSKYGWLQPYSVTNESVSVRVHSTTWPGDQMEPSRVSIIIY